MRIIYLAALLALALLAGCAAGPSGPQTNEDLLVECRAQADQFYKGRYNTPWNQAVEDCLKEHQGE